MATAQAPATTNILESRHAGGAASLAMRMRTRARNSAEGFTAINAATSRSRPSSFSGLGGVNGPPDR
jgi:hypothetical protein